MSFPARLAPLCALLALAPLAQAQLSPDLKAKADAKAKELAAAAASPKVVEAVRARNAATPPDAAAMTNEKWKSLTQLDPFVRSFSKCPAALDLKAHMDPAAAEWFLSASDGTKIAFLAKPSNWSHKGKDKHQQPLAGKTWFGPVEVDESSGLQQFQIAVPVLDAGKPIGSLVAGFAVSRLK